MKKIMRPEVAKAMINGGVLNTTSLLSIMRNYDAGRDLTFDGLAPLIYANDTSTQFVSAAYDEDGKLTALAKLMAQVLSVKDHESLFGQFCDVVPLQEKLTDDQLNPDKLMLNSEQPEVKPKMVFSGVSDIAFPGAAKTFVVDASNVPDPEVDVVVAKIMAARGQRFDGFEPDDGPDF